MSTLAQQPEIKQVPRNKVKDTAIGFIIGGIAACGAVTFTNPWEVKKKKKKFVSILTRETNWSK
jgi:solute carrier family 25 protein 34/35